MMMAFIGTHIPLASYFALQSAPDWQTFFTTVGITLLATLARTALTLFMLNAPPRPIFLNSRALRAYHVDRRLLPLPTGYRDEVGTPMADPGLTFCHLESTRDRLEHSDETTSRPNQSMRGGPVPRTS